MKTLNQGRGTTLAFDSGDFVVADTDLEIPTGARNPFAGERDLEK